MSKPKLPTIKSLANNFILLVVDKNAPEIQKVEMAKSFHAGAFSVLELLSNVITAMSDEEGINYLESLHQEMRDYLAKLKK